MSDTRPDGPPASRPQLRAPGRPPARAYEGPPRKMIEVTAPTHAAIVEIAHKLSSELGRAVTMAEATERVVDFWKTERT